MGRSGGDRRAQGCLGIPKSGVSPEQWTQFPVGVLGFLGVGLGVSVVLG